MVSLRNVGHPKSQLQPLLGTVFPRLVPESSAFGDLLQDAHQDVFHCGFHLLHRGWRAGSKEGPDKKGGWAEFMGTSNHCLYQCTFE